MLKLKVNIRKFEFTYGVTKVFHMLGSSKKYLWIISCKNMKKIVKKNMKKNVKKNEKKNVKKNVKKNMKKKNFC